MGLLGRLKRSVRPAVWAALEAAHPNMFWRLRSERMLADANQEREVRLAPLLCSPDMLALDVGAAQGVYSIRLCQRAKRVIAFEAQPRQAARLDAMIRANSLSVQVENVALSDHSGSVALRVPRRDRGRATIEQMNALDDLGEAEQIEVPTRRLDEYELADVGFIKIDVEGHELAVLRGGKQTIRRSEPVLLLELENRHHPNAVAEATDFLKALGYYGYFFTQEGLQPITRFDPSVHQNEANIPRPPHYDQVGRTYFNNFLFCTPDRAHLLFEGAARLEKHPAH